MDFSTQFQYDGAVGYGFVPMQPLTPSHTASATGSDDFGHASPPDGFDALGTSGDHDFAAAFDYTQDLAAFTQHQHQQQHQQQQQKGSPDDAQGGVAKGASEDDDPMAPALSRRKAQNRAAQRAFRERKEKHVKDLETKLASLEAAQHQASAENERLKRDLQKMSTENEILRATTSSSMSGGGPHNNHNNNNNNNSSSSSRASPPVVTTGPTEYRPTDFYSNVLQGHAEKLPSHRIVVGDDGERLLAAGATWDYIVSHELYRRGLVDVGCVSERLKGAARCDGQGPVFPESAILGAIEQSVASGSDDLL